MRPERNLALASSHTEPCAETKAMRPSTGLDAHESDRARTLVRQQMRAAFDHLPDGAALAEDAKDRIYAEVARMMAAEMRRPVAVDQIRLVAASMRSSLRSRTRHTAIVTPRHHALLRAEADAGETHITVVLGRILDTHFELSPEA